LQTFSNEISRAFVQLLTRFQLTAWCMVPVQ